MLYSSFSFEVSEFETEVKGARGCYFTLCKLRAFFSTGSESLTAKNTNTAFFVQGNVWIFLVSVYSVCGVLWRPQ